MLFIFDTICAQKLPLNVSSLLGCSVLEMLKCNLSTDSLRALLRNNNMKVPPDGSIVDKGTKGNLRLFFYQFHEDHITPCSKASDDDFEYVKYTEDNDRLFTLPTKLERNVAWSFFCLDSDQSLDLKNYFPYPDMLFLKPCFIYPFASSETDRMDILYLALAKHLSSDKSVVVSNIKNPGNTDHFCRFSGGGDIFISKKTVSMVISQQHDDPPDDYPSPRSPRNDSDHMSGFTVEGKKSEAKSIASLKYQLFADTVLNCVANFVTKCETENSEAFIRKVDKVIGYGAAYTGMGHVACYKLEVQFGHVMEFVTKVDLQHYSRPTSAAIIDHALDYFLKMAS